MDGDMSDVTISVQMPGRNRGMQQSSLHNTTTLHSLRERHRSPSPCSSASVKPRAHLVSWICHSEGLVPELRSPRSELRHDARGHAPCAHISGYTMVGASASYQSPNNPSAMVCPDPTLSRLTVTTLAPHLQAGLPVHEHQDALQWPRPHTAPTHSCRPHTTPGGGTASS